MAKDGYRAENLLSDFYKNHPNNLEGILNDREFQAGFIEAINFVSELSRKRGIKGVETIDELKEVMGQCSGGASLAANMEMLQCNPPNKNYHLGRVAALTCMKLDTTKLDTEHTTEVLKGGLENTNSPRRNSLRQQFINESGFWPSAEKLDAYIETENEIFANQTAESIAGRCWRHTRTFEMFIKEMESYGYEMEQVLNTDPTDPHNILVSKDNEEGVCLVDLLPQVDTDAIASRITTRDGLLLREVVLGTDHHLYDKFPQKTLG